MPFVRSADARIYWKLEGESGRPALVLLTSIGTDMDMWAPALARLRRHFQVLRIDTRGHGASDAPAGDYDLAMLAGDVAAAMDAAGIDAAIVAGVSLGGMIAMRMAVDTPERVAGLVLVCTSAAMDRAAWTTRVETVRAAGLADLVEPIMGRFLSPDFRAANPDIAATLGRALLSMDPAGYAGCAAAIRDMALADRLAAIAAPTLVVTGTRDISTPFEGFGDRLLAGIAGARHVALDAGHLPPLEVPDALATAIVDAFAT